MNEEKTEILIPDKFPVTRIQHPYHGDLCLFSYIKELENRLEQLEKRMEQTTGVIRKYL